MEIGRRAGQTEPGRSAWYYTRSLSQFPSSAREGNSHRVHYLSGPGQPSSPLTASPFPPPVPNRTHSCNTGRPPRGRERFAARKRPGTRRGCSRLIPNGYSRRMSNLCCERIPAFAGWGFAFLLQPSSPIALRLSWRSGIGRQDLEAQSHRACGTKGCAII
jgi:hypothetical protein